MKTIKATAFHYNITEKFYAYEMNDNGEVISLELFDGEYDDFPSCDYILQFVSHFKHLKRLHIDVLDCVISTLSPLEELHHLETLNFECATTLSDLESVYHLPKLKSIIIESSTISDLSPLVACKQLNSIGLPNSKISDISCLEKRPNLTWLDFSKNTISNIEVLKDLKQLTSITLSYNKIEDIEALREHTLLKYITLTGNSIKDLSPIAQSTQVINLRINKNQIENIQALEGYTGLKHINLSENIISDISVLKNKTNLEFVVLSKNPIKSLKPLTELPSIRNLYASGLELEDKENTKRFQSEIWYLDLSNNQFTDGTFLANQHQLLQLNLSNNTLKTFDWLKNMYRVKHIDLSHNRCEKPFPIYYFYGLDAIDLRGNPFGDAIYERFHGLASSSSIYTNKEGGTHPKLITDLEQNIVNYYYKKGDLELALAYSYILKKHKNKTLFKIYLSKLLATPKENLVYMKFYFYKMVLTFDNTLINLDEHTEYINQIRAHFDNIPNISHRKYLLECLEHFNYGNRVNATQIFNPLELVFYQRKHPNPHLTDELLYLKGTRFTGDDIKRENVECGLFYLKELYTRKSPFFYTLKHVILTTLDKHFAYTKPEREAHNYYMDIVRNIDKRTIEIPRCELECIAVGLEILSGYKFVYYDVDLVKQLNIPTPYNTEEEPLGIATGKNMTYYILLGLFIIIAIKALRWF